MCYVHPIYPSLCSHNYYILLAVCGPNASLRTCPSSSLIVTGPPGWDGRPKRIENGLCPRCDLGNEGVDLSQIRFYKPEKSSKKKRQKSAIAMSRRLGSRDSGRTELEIVEAGHSGTRPSLRERWSVEGHTLQTSSEFGHNHTSLLSCSPLRDKGLSHKNSVQSLPTPKIDRNREFGNMDVVDYSSDTEDEGGSTLDTSARSGHRRGLDRARRFWLKKSSANLKHLHENSSCVSSSLPSSPSHSSPIQAEKKKPNRGGKRRERLRTALRGMVEGLEHKLSAHAHHTTTTSEQGQQDDQGERL